MKFIIFVLMAIILILLIIGYSLLVMASEEDESAERMYEEWRENYDRTKGTDDI